MEGWIKLHRKLRENPLYSNSVALHCWIECLLRASHAENKLFLNRQKVLLKPGEFCMGRAEFGRAIGVSGSTAWFWILSFKADSMVDIKTSNKGSVVTILKWNEYQLLDIKLDNRKTTDEQQMNTNNNVKNVKNVKNNTHIGEIEKIILWAYTRARVIPSCSEDSYRRIVSEAIQRVGFPQVWSSFENEDNAIKLLQVIKNL